MSSYLDLIHLASRQLLFYQYFDSWAITNYISRIGGGGGGPKPPLPLSANVSICQTPPTLPLFVS